MCQVVVSAMEVDKVWSRSERTFVFKKQNGGFPQEVTYEQGRMAQGVSERSWIRVLFTQI